MENTSACVFLCGFDIELVIPQVIGRLQTSGKTPRHLGSTPIADFFVLYLKKQKVLLYSMLSDFQILRVDFCLQVNLTVRVVHDTQTPWKLSVRTPFFWTKSRNLSLAFCSSSSESVTLATEATPSLSSIPNRLNGNTTVVRYLEDT